MEQQLFNLFQFLSGAEFNFWPYLLLILLPVLVFSVSPEKKASIRIGRLVLAIGLSYIFWNLGMATHHHIEDIEYEACRSKFPDSEWQMPEECGNPFMGNGAQTVFALLLGWVPAAGYVGFWEFLWRRKHRCEIGRIGKQFKGKWFSTTLIVCSVPIWIYAGLVLILVIYMRTVCPDGVAIDKCWFPH